MSALSYAPTLSHPAPDLENLLTVSDTGISARFGAHTLTSHFQPIYGLSVQRPVGHEALLRSVGEDGTPFSPVAQLLEITGYCLRRIPCNWHFSDPAQICNHRQQNLIHGGGLFTSCCSSPLPLVAKPCSRSGFLAPSLHQGSILEKEEAWQAGGP